MAADAAVTVNSGLCACDGVGTRHNARTTAEAKRIMIASFKNSVPELKHAENVGKVVRPERRAWTAVQRRPSGIVRDASKVLSVPRHHHPGRGSAALGPVRPTQIHLRQRGQFML